MAYASDLAQFIAAVDYAALPQGIRHEAKRAVVNYLATAFGGWIDPTVDALLQLLAGLSGPPIASVIGSSTRLDPLNAAFMNAVSTNLLDFDDTHMPTIIHPSAPIAPALFALAERDGMTGEAFIAAFVTGVEVACRLGNSVSPAHYAKGWHITATCGIFGAAAASAKVMGLSGEQIAHALGIAASQSAGLVENLPNGAKNVQIGNAARNGLISASLASRGLTAAPEAIEGPRGWGAAMGVAPNAGILLGGLGQSWELSKNAYKASPCGIVLAPVIDAALALRSEYGVAGDAISAITITGNPLLLMRADRPVVPDDRIAKLSIHHSVAVAILCGAAGVEEFSEAAVHRPDVAELRGRVRAVADSAMPVEEAHLAAALKDGRTISVHVSQARGSLAKPLTDGELETKMRDLAQLGAPAVDTAPLLEAVWALDRLPDAGSIMTLTRPRATA